MKPLISIVVPIYKVEKYIHQCIDSILRQTYKNIEIILVDDGSPDNCGAICDFYAEKDFRIRVIHKENGGLSSARNAGLDICKGEYVSFIDSDDFVSPFFIEIFYEGVKFNNADIVSYSWPVSFIDGKDNCVHFCPNNHSFKICEITPHEALKQLLYQKIPNGAQHRLYKHIFFSNLRFPRGYVFEDVATVYKTFFQANRMVLITADVYAYRIRKDSIVRMKFSDKKMVSIPIAKNLFQDISNYDKGLQKAAASRAFALNFQVFLQTPSERKDKQQQLWDELIKYRSFVFKDLSRCVRAKNRIAVIISLLGMNVTYKIGAFFLHKT